MFKKMPLETFQWILKRLLVGKTYTYALQWWLLHVIFFLVFFSSLFFWTCNSIYVYQLRLFIYFFGCNIFLAVLALPAPRFYALVSLHFRANYLKNFQPELIFSTNQCRFVLFSFLFFVLLRCKNVFQLSREKYHTKVHTKSNWFIIIRVILL